MRSPRPFSLLVAAALSLPIPAAAGQTFALSEVFSVAWPTQQQGGYSEPPVYTSYPGYPMAVALSHGFAIMSLSSTEHSDAVVDGKLVDLSGQPGPRFFGEFLANDADAWMKDPAIAATGSGGFVLAWIVNPWRFQFRLFRPGAAPLDGSVIDEESKGNRCSTAVAGNAAGRFVAAWEACWSTTYVAARSFDPTGAPASGELAAPTPHIPLDGGTMPRVGMDAAGRFTVLWKQAGSTAGAPARLCGQSYGVRGGFLGATFCVGDLAGTTGGALAVDPTGTFLAAWFAPGPGTEASLFVRRYQMNGTPLGSPVQVGSGVAPSQLAASGDGHGNAALSWQQGDRLFVLPVRRDGVASGPIIAISGVTSHTSDFSDVYANGVALGDSGRLLVTWRSGDRVLGQLWQAGF